MVECKVLIISNNCLSQHNSNGRTLLNMIGQLKSENVFQIYTSGEYVDSQYCAKSFRLTNRDVVYSYLGIKPKNIIIDEQKSQEVVGENIGSKKNAFTMLLRDLAWDFSWIIKKGAINWAKEEKPNVILLQVGDSTLLITLATKIAKALNIPLVVYNTEDYYFKNYDFMKHVLSSGIIYKIFHRRFCKKFNYMMRVCNRAIYNCEGLKKIYDSHFETNSDVIYCATDIESIEHFQPISKGKIIYAGNLGVGRHKGLIEIGKELQKLDSKLYLDVYGNADDNVRRELEKSQGIRYNGFVSYEENIKNIKNSALLVHVESFDDFYSVDTRFAFSTKIADYSASGVPIFMFAPEWCESTQYMKKYDAAFIVDNKKDIFSTLKRALYNDSERMHKVKNAVQVARKNHQKQVKEQKFVGILKKICRF